MEKPKIDGLPFYLAAFFYSVSYLITKQSLRTSAEQSDNAVRNTEESLNLLDKSHLQYDKSKNHTYGILQKDVHLEETTVNLMHGNAESPLLPVKHARNGSNTEKVFYGITEVDL